MDVSLKCITLLSLLSFKILLSAMLFGYFQWELRDKRETVFPIDGSCKDADKTVRAKC